MKSTLDFLDDLDDGRGVLGGLLSAWIVLVALIF